MMQMPFHTAHIVNLSDDWTLSGSRFSSFSLLSLLRVLRPTRFRVLFRVWGLVLGLSSSQPSPSAYQNQMPMPQYVDSFNFFVFIRRTQVHNAHAHAPGTHAATGCRARAFMDVCTETYIASNRTCKAGTAASVCVRTYAQRLACVHPSNRICNWSLAPIFCFCKDK
jgi:hypothetical protein